MTASPLPPVMSAPKSVDIAVTGRCNLSCKYCFYADEMTALADLPTERWLAFFKELGNLAVQRVTLTGGEALTRPDFFELVDGVIANRMRYSLLSNGTLFTEKTIEKFQGGKRRLRLDSIQVSIDGSQADIHNQSRPGSFDRAIRGLRLLLEAQFPVTVRVTVNRHNVDDLENTARLLLEDVGLPSFSTNEAYPCGAVERSAGIMLTPAQRRQAMQVLTELTTRYNRRIGAAAGPLAMARHIKEMQDGLAAGKTTRPGRGALVSCGGVFSKMAVLHDGAIVPCHNLSTLRMGAIGVDSLQEIWLRHPLINAVRQRRNIPLQSLDTCADCPYIGHCAGGCPGGAVFLMGELNARNPMDCYRVLKGEDPYYKLEEG